jgi:hemerythrin
MHQNLTASLDERFHGLNDKSAKPNRAFGFLLEWFALHTSNEDAKRVPHIAEYQS